MKNIFGLNTAWVLTAILAAAGLLTASAPAALAAHGCPENEPDRDGDGIPDKDDPFPDDPAQTPQMRIFFIPFSAPTTAEVSIQDIETASEIEVWVFDNPKVLQDFGQFLQKPKEEAALDNTRVRLKIEWPLEKHVVYVDAAGVGLLEEEENNFLLSTQDLSRLEEKIKDLRGIVDMNDHRKMTQESDIDKDLFEETAEEDAAAEVAEAPATAVP